MRCARSPTSATTWRTTCSRAWSRPAARSVPGQLQPQDGQISIEGLEEAAAPLAEANTALQDEVARVDALRPDDMFGAVAGPVRELQDRPRRRGHVTDRAPPLPTCCPRCSAGTASGPTAAVPDQCRGPCHRRHPRCPRRDHRGRRPDQARAPGVATTSAARTRSPVLPLTKDELAHLQ